MQEGKEKLILRLWKENQEKIVGEKSLSLFQILLLLTRMSIRILY